MPLRPSRRTLVLLIAGAAGLAGLTVLPGAGATAAPVAASSAVSSSPSGQHGSSWPDRFRLPDGFAPEGIAIGRGTSAFFGSRETGAIYRADLRTGRGRVINDGPGTPSLGMKVDRRQRLFVAGGTGGDARVIDTRTGRVLRSYSFASQDTFVNDVVLTRRFAWFTDSLRPRLYGIPLGRHGRLPGAAAVVTLPLRGDWQQTPDLNANGIVATPDGRALLVVQSSTGRLFRVPTSTGVARPVDLGGLELTNGDGLLTRGRTLYAVQNALGQVSVVRLCPSGRAGQLVAVRTARGLDFPTTAARFGRWLYLPNARFSTPVTPNTRYTVNRVRA